MWIEMAVQRWGCQRHNGRNLTRGLGRCDNVCSYVHKQLLDEVEADIQAHNVNLALQAVEALVALALACAPDHAQQQ